MDRFDRNQAGGRRGIVSLQTLDAEFVGSGTGTWAQLTTHLGRTVLPGSTNRVITQEAVTTASRLYAFGVLIGNTDMHAGNLAFYHDGSPPLSLAPLYDMLPMGYAPTSSGTLRETLPPFRLPDLPAVAVWPEMADLARRYWQLVMEDARGSDALARIGLQHLAWLEDAERQIGRAV